MLKVLDYIVLAVFVIALIVLCFLQQCGLDIYFLVLGFVVAVMCGLTLFFQHKKDKDKKDSDYEAKVEG